MYCIYVKCPDANKKNNACIVLGTVKSLNWYSMEPYTNILNADFFFVKIKAMYVVFRLFYIHFHTHIRFKYASFVSWIHFPFCLPFLPNWNSISKILKKKIMQTLFSMFYVDCISKTFFFPFLANQNNESLPFQWIIIYFFLKKQYPPIINNL